MKTSSIMIKNYFIPLLFLMLYISCSDKAEPLVNPDFSNAAINPDDLNITILKDHAAADTTDYIEILFKGGPTILNKYQEVSFDISPYGIFTNGNTAQKVTLDVNGEAKVFATSGVAGITSIRATIGTTSKQSTAQFTTAWPDQIFIEPDSSFLPPIAGMYTNVKARLVRSTGAVSSGLIVNFYDSVAPTGSVGIFLNTGLSDPSGQATTQYWLQNTTFHDYVYINGYVDTDDGRVYGQNRIKIR